MQDNREVMALPGSDFIVSIIFSREIGLQLSGSVLSLSFFRITMIIPLL